MPATNGQLKRETRSDLTGNGVPRPGCLYTGPTKITFNANGTITVRSPWTKATRTAGDPATSGTTPTRVRHARHEHRTARALGRRTFDLPANNVIYVQNVPGHLHRPELPARAVGRSTARAARSPARGRSTGGSTRRPATASATR